MCEAEPLELNHPFHRHHPLLFMHEAPYKNERYISDFCNKEGEKSGLSIYVSLQPPLNHMCHHKHPLVLQFNSDRLSCKICDVNRRRGLVYGCTACKLVMHIECLSTPLVVEDNSHPHPLTPFPRRAPFICDACGTEGTYVSYICSTCNITLHKRCILLPHIIKSKSHNHCLFHKYFLPHGFGLFK
ncbi:hypothetical protein GQ457_02G033320 [Hibiscus cannabinus]